MRDDISLIKCSAMGLDFFPPHPRAPCQAALAAWRTDYLRLRASGAFRAARPLTRAVIDILSRRQEAADQVLPRRGLEAARSANSGLKGAGMFGSSNEPLFALAAPWPPWGRPHKGFLFGLEDSLSKNCPLKN